MKHKLREWLIQLICEAMRREMVYNSQIFPANGGIAVYDAPHIKGQHDR